MTEDDLRNLLSKKPAFRLYDGFEPSGRMHIAQGIFKVGWGGLGWARLRWVGQGLGGVGLGWVGVGGVGKVGWEGGGREEEGRG